VLSYCFIAVENRLLTIPAYIDMSLSICVICHFEKKIRLTKLRKVSCKCKFQVKPDQCDTGTYTY